MTCLGRGDDTPLTLGHTCLPEMDWRLITRESPDFSHGECQSLSYVIRMMPKRGYTPEGYFEYTVYPLEGLWDLTEKGRKLDRLNKDELLYTIMIRQPDFVTEEVVDKAFEIARKKEPHSLLDKVYFGTIEDGLSVQMLHIGPYDTEPQSFEMMKKFIELEFGK